MAKWEEYNKTRWVNNQTPINESNMNNIEQGIEDNRDNTLDLKVIAESLLSAFNNKLTLTFDKYSHMLTFKAGDSETSSIILAQASAQIFTDEAEVEELYSFLHQVAYSYSIYWNILRYTQEADKLQNIKLLGNGDKVIDSAYMIFDRISLARYKSASIPIDTLLPSTTGQTQRPLYSVGFYNEMNEMQSVIVCNGLEAINVPNWAVSIAVCCLMSEQDSVAISTQEEYFEDYTVYKMKNSLNAGRGIMINGNTISCKLYYKDRTNIQNLTLADKDGNVLIDFNEKVLITND